MPNRIDLNAASSDELSQVLEIDGPVAERIIAERARRGGFREVEELARVEGVDDATLSRMRERLIVSLPDVDTVNPAG